MKTFDTFLHWAAVVLSIVTQIETSLPPGTPGATKKTVAAGLMGVTEATSGVLDLIDHTVGVLNATGVFKKGQTGNVA